MGVQATIRARLSAIRSANANILTYGANAKSDQTVFFFGGAVPLRFFCVGLAGARFFSTGLAGTCFRCGAAFAPRFLFGGGGGGGGGTLAVEGGGGGGMGIGGACGCARRGRRFAGTTVGGGRGGGGAGTGGPASSARTRTFCETGGCGGGGGAGTGGSARAVRGWRGIQSQCQVGIASLVRKVESYGSVRLWVEGCWLVG